MCKQHALRIAWTIARSIAFLDFRVLRWKFTYDWKCVNTTYRVPLFMPTACFPEGPSPPFTFCSFWRRRPRLEAVIMLLFHPWYPQAWPIMLLFHHRLPRHDPLHFSSILGNPGMTHYATLSSLVTQVWPIMLLPSLITQVWPIMLLFHHRLPRHDPLHFSSILGYPGMTHYVTLPSSVTQAWPITLIFHHW